MMIVPIYDLLLLPNVTCYFQGSYLRQLSGKDIQIGESVIFLMLKENKEKEAITVQDFYPIGITGMVEQIDNDDMVYIDTRSRMDVSEIGITDGELQVEYARRPDREDLNEEEEKARFEEMKSSLLSFLENTPWEETMRNYSARWKSMSELVSFISYMFPISPEEKYEILSQDSKSQRADLLEKVFYGFLEMMKVRTEAQSAQKETNERLYREDAIKKQIQFLQEKLDELHPENMTDVQKFEEKIRESGMNETARAEAERVLNRMKQEGENGHEYGMLYEYLDFVTGLSWKKEDMPEIDLTEAKEILDRDHYGLKKPKQRIIQQIAVMNLNKKQSGSILLFVGAPGTGKTSIGQSIARALHRKYVRISLGGIRDEAEIRGHRRTYVGAMPGRIMQGIRRSGATNPVVVLDEVDKLAQSYNGDPASALLEVLDPEQNNTFTDHYMNVPYDLSDVLFLCTANTTDTIPEPLLNRMESIPFSGYTATEKLQIARRHLLPNAMKSMGIRPENLNVTDETIRTIISDYTMESGVRGLKSRLDTLCRFAAVKLVQGEEGSITVHPEQLKEFLDQKPIRHEQLLKMKRPGIVTGLAWTSAGGDILFIETVFVKGSGKIVITGQLGDVMKESAQIAVSVVKSMFPEKAELFEKNDLHIHVPSGAVPKDGPSAGITLVTSIASLVEEKAVSPEIAMTGEVSLRGVVMPVGGLPEKLMAAHRAGITRVFLPEGNRDDLEDVAAEVKEDLTITFVSEVGTVLRETGITE